MVTAIAILGGICLLSLASLIYLSYLLYITSEEKRMAERKSLDIPDPVKWDYTRETGWVDAEVEDAESEL